MNDPTNDELRRQLRTIATWGEPDAVPDAEMLASSPPTEGQTPELGGSRRRWWVGAAAAILVLVVGVWAATRGDDSAVVTDEPNEIDGLPPDAGSFPWLLPPESSTLQLAVLTTPSEASTSNVASTVLFADGGLASADLSVGWWPTPRFDLDVRDERVFLPGQSLPLPTATASVVEIAPFGQVVIVCGAALPSTGGDPGGTSDSGATVGPLRALWEVSGHQITLTSDTTQIEDPRPGCDATGTQAESLRSTIRGLRQVSEAEWRAALEEQDVRVREVSAEPSTATGAGG